MKRPTSASSGEDTSTFTLPQPDRFVQECFAMARANMKHCHEEAAGYARQEPEKALLVALAAGYFLRILPVAAILSRILCFALALLKPATLLYGAAKLWYKVCKEDSLHSKDSASSTGNRSQRAV